MYRFLVVVEEAKSIFSACPADLPGCVATGKTIEETTANMREAVEMHIDRLLEDNLPVPEPQSCAEYVSVPF